MKFSQVTCFSLWGLTAFVAAGFLLSLRPASIESLNHIGDIDSVSYAAADIPLLFQQPAAAPHKQSVSASNDAMQLQGIVFSNTPAQSRALIQMTGGTAKHYAVGSRLPNGADLVEISKRQITYDLGGVHKTLMLPKS